MLLAFHLHILDSAWFLALTWRRETRHPSSHPTHTSHRPSHAHRRHTHPAHHPHGAPGEASTQVLLEQRIRLALGVVRICYAVDDLLCLVAADLFVVGLDVAQVVATVVVSFAHAHTVVREIYIAVVAEELWHCGGGVGAEVSGGEVGLVMLRPQARRDAGAFEESQMSGAEAPMVLATFRKATTAREIE